MDGGGDQQSWRDPAGDLELMGEEGGWSSNRARPVHHCSHVRFGDSLGTLPVAFHNLFTRALGLNLDLSQLAMTSVIFSWHNLVHCYPALQPLQGALVRLSRTALNKQQIFRSLRA